MVTLSVLDQSPVRSGGSVADALSESVRLAQATERLGYRRYWFAEHHNTGGLACPAPEIMIAHVAAHTSTIRVGSGGVMLSHYSPLKVAEVFRMLEALHPGRIDLGIGRAPGSDQRTAQILAYGRTLNVIEHFPSQIVELQGFLTGGFPSAHPYHSVRATPDSGRVPELWILGSTDAGAQYAAHFGWGFSFAQFINPEGGEDIARWYKEHFRPSAQVPEPRVTMGVAVTCADDEEEAEGYAMARWASRILSLRGQRTGMLPPGEARAFLAANADPEYLAHQRRSAVYGTPAQVREKLLALAERYDVDELIVLTNVYDFGARVRSYELLAEAFDLRPPAAAAAEEALPAAAR